MKKKIIKLLYALGWETLLWGLFEKLMLGLIKKLKNWADALQSFLNRAKNFRNEVLSSD